MKVDIIVNSMIQQIDRNLQTQALPPLAFRPGELLRGRVMLGGDDRPQIRLDSGALLEALPAGDVMLMPGATVTLRVSGRVDGQLVMQLLEQDVTSGQATAPPGAGEDAALSKLGLNSTPQGRAVTRALEGMNLPLREETVRQALDILAAYPGLEPEKAAFLAANRLPATQARVDALNNLLRGATTGGELIRLADILSSQALEAENVALAEDYEYAPPSTAPQGKATGAENAAAAEQTAQAAPEQTGQAGGGGRAAGRTAGSGRALEDETPAVGRYAADMPGWEDAHLAPPEGSREEIPVFQTAGAEARQAQPAIFGEDGALKLQGLVFAALGMEAAERYSPALAALDEAGLSAQAAELALDAPFLDEPEFSARLGALLSALPQDAAPAARDFMLRLSAGLKNYIRDNGPELPLLPQAPEAREGIPHIVREIAELFVKMGAGEADPGETLAKAASEQKARIAHISSEIGKAADAGPEARRQMNSVENHVRLVGDISQYAFRQIPMQMDGRNRTVEIYVLNRKGGGKKIKADNANILLALDTDNLGRVETLINVSSKNLRVRFGVERPGLVGYVGSFSAEIGEAVKKIGYRLSDIRTEVVARRTTPLNAAEAAGGKPAPSGTLDIKL